MIDFGYHYGLLPLSVGRVWFGLFGRTPAAYQAAIIVCQLLMVWGLARFSVAIRVSREGLALLIVTMPFVVPASYVNLSHTLEAVLICHALAQHANGRRTSALALATACLFVKPTMAYVYGLLLVVIIAYRALAVDRLGLVGFIRMLLPAAATGVALAALLAVLYGPMPVVTTVWPVAGIKAHAGVNQGFFRGSGRDFWLPTGARAGYYLGTMVGFWLLGTACLISAALLGALRRPRGAGSDMERRVLEIIVTCTAMHLAFVCVFFGNAWSWTYYFYVLIMGLMAVARRSPLWAFTVCCLIAVALLGQKTHTTGLISDWSTTSRHAETAGLWSTAEERSEWNEVMPLLRGHGAVMLGPQGGAVELLFPEAFAPPVDLFLNPGLTLPEEVRRKADQIAAAPRVLMSYSNITADEFLTLWPAFRRALDGCEIAHDGVHFRVYKRLRPPSRFPQP